MKLWTLVRLHSHLTQSISKILWYKIVQNIWDLVFYVNCKGNLITTTKRREKVSSAHFNSFISLSLHVSCQLYCSKYLCLIRLFCFYKTTDSSWVETIIVKYNYSTSLILAMYCFEVCHLQSIFLLHSILIYKLPNNLPSWNLQLNWCI